MSTACPRPGSTASATKCRSRRSPAYPRRTVRAPAGRRRSSGRDSGMKNRTIAPSTTPPSARTQKTARQVACAPMNDPMEGARSGASPMTSMSRDRTRAASDPVNRSRMAAIATTDADALKNPWSTRRPTRMPMLGANAHRIDVTTCSESPTSTGRRRP
ncbi:Uncharacterised protein [Mycobacteroides abscessus]|nr:Uncharacterised protein [Mycobacteroides abscessus]